MKNRGIAFFILITVAVVLVVIIIDFNSTKTGKRPGNPYEYNVEKYKSIDPELIKYKETKQIKIDAEDPKGVFSYQNRIYLIADNYIQVLDEKGNQYKKKTLPRKPYCLFVDEKIIIGYKNQLSIFDSDLNENIESAIASDISFFTSVAVKDNIIFVADAGQRKILKYNKQAEKVGEFEGKSNAKELHGFIIPSPYFDIAVNNTAELWIVNPGLHALQNYTTEGKLRGYWSKSSISVEGFSGCCNPAHFTFLPDGKFVTSEKGMVRIKVYEPSGMLHAVVAPPSKFKEEGHAPDVTVNNKGTIIALDMDLNVIRFFENQPSSL